MSTESDIAGRASAATEMLKNALPGRVITSQNATEHKIEQSRSWSTTCWTPAAAYVRPTTAEEVAKALTIVSQSGCKFAIRSTGHNPNPGYSNVDESGIVIDLGGLTSLSLTEAGILQAGAGNTWGRVYAWLEERQRSATGGRESAVGISGFLLGGGLGPFPNLHGVGADGVKNFEVVLADGTIVNANEDTNGDLFHSLKGGGSNFGIVTRFDIITYPLLNIQYAINVYNAADLDNLLEATVEVQTAMESDPNIGLFVNFRKGVVIVGMFYADQPLEKPKAFESFLSLSSLVQAMLPTTNGTLSSLVQTLDRFHIPEDGKRAVAALSTKVSHDLYADIYGSWQSGTSTLATGVDLHFTIQPVGTACVQAGQSRGGNVLGLEKVPQCWFVFTAEWLADEHDTDVSKAHAAIAEKEFIFGVEASVYTTAKKEEDKVSYDFKSQPKS
ncbi:hypothetical protein G7054_g7835 [Neopestalotiopsis clavispora]|nr:hypothetical protein G7054_g7835 [Neopestalotiopsis clavispora]